MKILIVISLLFSSILANELVTLKTRNGIKQRILINEIKNSSAIALLFPGGKGKLKLHKNKANWKLNNFLIRSRRIFNQNNITTVSIDAPSKLKGGMIEGFRTSNEHLSDIRFIIDYIKSRYKNTPIWLIGTSRGTVSATFNVLNQEKINGLVLTSPFTVYNKGTSSITDLDLEQINIPTLIITHTKDKCKVTPVKGAKMIYSSLNERIKKEYKEFEGGKNKHSNPCKATTYHGFLGIENEVVTFISKWIKDN